jgi:hypothetical protein
LVGREVNGSRSATVARVDVRGHCIEVIPFVSLPIHAVAESSTEVFRGRLTR